ncbi:hypothetical protein AAV98_19165 [Bacillus sp. CHD6a]|nr:hypothetical protein AAV98_19165 [Bacillus sp. CHD6a]
MPFFERVKRLSKILFGISGIFIFLIIISYMNYPYEENNTILYRWACLIFSIFSLTLAITLKFIIKDAKDYIDRAINFKS